MAGAGDGHKGRSGAQSVASDPGSVTAIGARGCDHYQGVDGGVMGAPTPLHPHAEGQVLAPTRWAATGGRPYDGDV